MEMKNLSLSYTVLLAQASENPDRSIRTFLEQRNMEVLECTDGIEAVRRSFSKNPDLIILDTSLPRLSGFQCTRILKSDPVINSTPIIHMGSSGQPIDQYWATVSGGDGYLQKPISEMALDEVLRQLLRKRGGKRRLLGPVSMLQNLEDFSILTMNANLLEQELLRVHILNEINRIDIFSLPPKDLVTGLISIINSLYDFTLGVVLLLYDQQAEFFFYPNARVEQTHLEEVKTLVLKYLRQRQGPLLDPQETSQTLLPTAQLREVGTEVGDVYIHTKESGPVRSVLAFEDIGFDNLRKDEQGILNLALDMVQGVLEKKIFFQMSQELSIIDAATEGYSMPFFMAILAREIESASRNSYPLILFTLAVTNLEEVTKGLGTQQVRECVASLNNIIMKVSRKSDIVARWEIASFAFLLTYTPLEKAILAQERIINFIKKELSERISLSAGLKVGHGISEFRPEQDRSPEIFFARAKPKDTSDVAPSSESPIQ